MPLKYRSWFLALIAMQFVFLVIGYASLDMGFNAFQGILTAVACYWVLFFLLRYAMKLADARVFFMMFFPVLLVVIGVQPFLLERPKFPEAFPAAPTSPR